MALAGLSCLLISLSYQYFGNPYIAYIAFVPLIIYLASEKRLLYCALATYISGLGVILVIYQQISVFSLFDHLLFLFIYGSIYSIPGIVVCLSQRFFGKIGIWSLSLSWVAMEMLTNQLHWWDRWAYPLAIGYSQGDSFFSRLSYYTDISGISIFVMVVNISMYFLLIERQWKPFVYISTIGLVVSILPNLTLKQKGLPIKIAIINANVTKGEYFAAKVDWRIQEKLLDRFIQLSKKAIRENPSINLLIWSGYSANFDVGYNKKDYLSILSPIKIPIIFFGDSKSSTQNNTTNAFCWNGSNIGAFYDQKMRNKISADNMVSSMPIDFIGVKYTKLVTKFCDKSPIRPLNVPVDEERSVLIYFHDDQFARNATDYRQNLRFAAIHTIKAKKYVVFISQVGPSIIFDPLGEIIFSNKNNSVALTSDQ